MEDDNIELLGNSESSPLAELMIQINGFISIEDAEIITTLDKTTQYRQRRKGQFPEPVELTSSERRKAYRVEDIIKWLKSPTTYKKRDKLDNKAYKKCE
ncbi:hypothetical protein [Gracilimonas sp.]|uniref:helix-turn-helix transcriptional regulator n=1 Tax=Gracilimonas sp. TaxID=1974203 RepID=UPI0032EC3257